MARAGVDDRPRTHVGAPWLGSEVLNLLGPADVGVALLFSVGNRSPEVVFPVAEAMDLLAIDAMPRRRWFVG